MQKRKRVGSGLERWGWLCALLACADDGPFEQHTSFVVAATEQTFSAPYAAQISGAGDLAIKDIAIESNWGTLSLDGRVLPALAFSSGYWDQADADLVQLLAVERERVSVIFIYCKGDGQFTELYYVSSDQPAMFHEKASGSCALRSEVSTTQVAFPALALPPPEVVRGFTVHSGQVELEEGRPGRALLEGSLVQFYPFAALDCTLCDSPGWWELHSIFWDGSLQRASYGIVYLHPGSSVGVSYTIGLPDLRTDLAGFEAQGAWTAAPTPESTLRGVSLREVATSGAASR